MTNPIIWILFFPFMIGYLCGLVNFVRVLLFEVFKIVFAALFTRSSAAIIDVCVFFCVLVAFRAMSFHRSLFLPKSAEDREGEQFVFDFVRVSEVYFDLHVLAPRGQR